MNSIVTNLKVVESAGHMMAKPTATANQRRMATAAIMTALTSLRDQIGVELTTTLALAIENEINGRPTL